MLKFFVAFGLFVVNKALCGAVHVKFVPQMRQKCTLVYVMCAVLMSTVLRSYALRVSHVADIEYCCRLKCTTCIPI